MSKQPLAVRWRLALRDDDRPSRSAKFLGLVLSTYTDNGTGSTYAGLPTLARNCGFSVDTARRARNELHRLKYLEVTQRSGQTSLSTLRLPLAPVRGVPLARGPITPGTGATQSLDISDGGALNGAPPVDPEAKRKLAELALRYSKEKP